MPKVILFIATSLDGYIASEEGTVDWLFHDADYGYSEFFGSIGAVVMGRKTWDQAKSFEAIPFEGKQVFVFSRRAFPEESHRVHRVHGEARTIVDEVRTQIGEDMWLVGGGELVRQFIVDRLIDEFRIFVHPILLGKGIPLFLPHADRSMLRFLGSQAFPSGLVELRYRLASKDRQA